MPTAQPLFDPLFRKRQLERAAARPRVPSAIEREAWSRIQERLEDLKTPPPSLLTSCLEWRGEDDAREGLSEAHGKLGPGGLFLGVMAGGETLRELRLCLMEAELALTGGASPRTAPMIELAAAGDLLAEAGFASPVADSERVTLLYPDLFALMKALRNGGWTNGLSARSRRFAPRRLFDKAARIYADRFPAPGGAGIAVTVDLVFLHGWRS